MGDRIADGHQVMPFGRNSYIDRQKTGTITREYAVA